jgi:hypothetical protein
MLPLIVALFWLAILVPWGVVKFRNSRAERSIDSFHAEHEVLSRQGYSVAPARRLDDAYLYEEHAYEPDHASERARPRLTVVQDGDTYSSLEGRLSWDEWERDYDYDEPRSAGLVGSLGHPAHRYAAYASSPSPSAYAPPEAHGTVGYGFAPVGVSMRVRRHRFVASLGLGALATTGLNLLVGLTVLQYVAILSWAALVFYVAAALYAVSQGYLEVSSLMGRPSAGERRYEDVDAEIPAGFEEGLDDERFENEYSYGGNWRREPRRYALG